RAISKRATIKVILPRAFEKPTCPNHELRTTDQSKGLTARNVSKCPSPQMSPLKKSISTPHLGVSSCAFVDQIPSTPSCPFVAHFLPPFVHPAFPDNSRKLCGLADVV